MASKRLSSLSFFKKRTAPPGSHPGAFVACENNLEPRLTVMHYDEDGVEEHPSPKIEQIRAFQQKPGLCWIDIQGLGKGELIQQIADIYQLHPLAVEDVFHVPQRPKTESYGADYLFLVTRMPMQDDAGALVLEQLSIFFGPDWVITIQELYGDTLDPVRKHIRGDVGPIRQQGADYLAYSILDAVIDGYYPALDALNDRLADLEEDALENPTKRVLRETREVRSTLLALHRVLWPQREAIHALARLETPLVSDTVRLYMRDIQDHCSQLSEVVESYREVVSGISSTWVSAVGNRTNDVMKVLTIMASIFIPLNFLAALYGMNFDNMPELHYR
ncbi:MAG: magnesium/cobalt transporter CorA, partial [Acidobacteria bacterium]|nr:magnesium/cobalt transporter CorA [Acidobacteriota bacterium]